MGRTGSRDTRPLAEIGWSGKQEPGAHPLCVRSRNEARCFGENFTLTSLLVGGITSGVEQEQADGLFVELYGELGDMASALLRRELRDHTLPPAALVHEAWLRLGAGSSGLAADRTRFLAVAGRAMRQLLVEHARRRAADKRGGGWDRISICSGLSGEEQSVIDMLELELALSRFAKLHPRAAHIVELRFFAGLEEREVAIELELSRTTVQADWRMARAWLHRELKK